MRLSYIDYMKVLAIDLYLFRKDNRNSKRIRFFISLRRLLAKSKYSVASSPNVFFQSMRRNDYDEMFRRICNEFVGVKSVVVQVEDKGKFDLFFFYYFFQSFFLLKRKNFGSVVEYLFSAITYASYIKSIACLGNNVKILVVFSDMQPVDNLLVQVAKKCGAKTVTLQHGLYVDYEGFDNVNKFNYLNQESDIFLSWGEDTKRLINKYQQSKVIICGKPIALPVTRAEGVSYFTVVFDQNLFHDVNVELLQLSHFIAEKFNLKINLRLHPRNKLSCYDYDESITVVNKPVAESKFVIGHTSSFIYECMRAGVPIFKFVTDIPSNITPDTISFRNADELYEKYLGSNKIEFDELGKFYLDVVGSESLARYKNVFSNIFLP